MSQQQDTTAHHVLESYGVIHRRFYKVKLSGPRCFSREETQQYQSITSFFMNAFLPYGYPHSVSEDYLQYQIFDSIQAFASSITGSVCTHSLLKGVGVGDASASVLAATITWLFKDGVSMLGRIGFAWLQGTNLDTDCKKWRLFADILNDLAMLLDLLSAYFQNYFTCIICISGVMKSIVGVAGGCTRAALTQHQAIKNNMADVSAKDGSQETLVNFIALLCSLVILPIVTKSLMLTWILYFMMTAIHLTANYFAVKSVVMKTFNETRFEIFTNHYLNQAINKSKFLTVAEVNNKENVFFNYSQEEVQIQLGVSFADIVRGRKCEEVHEMLKMYKEANYLLRVYRKSSSNTSIFVTLNKKATSVTVMEAFYQALFVKKLLQHPRLLLKAEEYETNLEVASREYTLKTYNDFKKTLDGLNYNTETVLFKIDLWRAEW